MALVPATRVAPEIAAELRQQIARINAGPLRLPGIPGSDDPGFVSAYAPQVEYHPDAERLAAQLRAAREHSVDPETIADWLEMLSYGGARFAPAHGAEMAAYIASAAMACGHFPLSVWSQDALKDALRTLHEWPSMQQLNALLQRHDDRQLAEIAALDSIAKGERVASGPARESTVPYVLPPPPQREAHASMPKHDPAADLVRIDAASVDAQLAAFGYTRDTVPPLKPRGDRNA